MSDLKFILAGDSALFCRLSKDISPDISRKVIALHNIVKNKFRRDILETVPSYTGLMIYYNPVRINVKEIEFILKEEYGKTNAEENATIDSRYIKLPVCYEREFSPDLEIVSRVSGLSPDEVIELHSSKEYLVYMIGFTPGFPYLGGLDEKLETPRKEEPRTKIRAGSVGIAGKQTGIYPIDSPGGWQIIGKTPLLLYNPGSRSPFLFSPGDHVEFIPINLKEYFNIGEKVRLGTYGPEIRMSNERN